VCCDDLRCRFDDLRNRFDVLRHRFVEDYVFQICVLKCFRISYLFVALILVQAFF
jgi:hypothetical protein